MNLDKITARFGRAYKRQKTAERWLKLSQKKLFQALDEDLKNRTLAQKTVEYPSECVRVKQVKEWVSRHHPGWAIVTYVGDNRVLLEEDPSKMSHTYINDGVVYGRDQVNGTPSLDDELLKAEDPVLWESVTIWPPHMYELARHAGVYWTRDSAVTWTSGVLDSLAEDILRDAGVERQLKDPHKMTTAELAALQDYVLPGAVSVRLRPPRIAKEDDV